MLFYLEYSYFIDAALIFHEENFENVMFYDFIYLAKRFRMRP